MNVYLQGIEALEEDSELIKERIKALDNYS
jgi:hypothetical protein